MLLLKNASFIQSLCTYKNASRCMRFSIFAANRNLLPDAYNCNEAWDKFLTSDFIKKIDLTRFSSELESKMNLKQLVTPLDMDILAAKAVYADNLEQLDFIESLFVKFRKTQAALYVRESMHHSFVRSYIDLGIADRLLDIFALKYKYGIYPDCYTANILMNMFLNEKNYANSAQVAAEVMLQEFNENQLTMALSAFSCWKYLSSLKNVKVEPDVSEGTANATDAKVEKQLVNFLRNPHFDDHFDIKNFEHLIGKTLYFSCKNLKIDNALVNSLAAYGLTVFEKFEKVVTLLQEMGQSKKKVLKSILEEFEVKIKEYKPTSDVDKERIEKVLKTYEELDKAGLTSNEDVDIGKQLSELFEKIKKERVEKDIKEQQELIQKWTNEQSTELKGQIRNFLVEEKKKSILDRLNYLERQEEILTFFDNQDKIRISYFNKGFVKENPSDIPLPAEQAQFDQLFERHFKHYKKKNKPARLMSKSTTQKLKEEALMRLYGKEPEKEEANP